MCFSLKFGILCDISKCDISDASKFKLDEKSFNVVIIYEYDIYETDNFSVVVS